LAVLDVFVDAVRGAGSVPLVLLLPVRREVARFVERGHRPHSVVAAHLGTQGVDVVDLLDVLTEGIPDGGMVSLFKRRHYSAAAHGRIAARLQEEMERLLAIHADARLATGLDQSAGEHLDRSVR
jgi:hypothetical protein